MKRLSNPVLPSPQKKDDAIKLDPCCECGKPITDGYYGRYAEGGVCSKACDILHMKERKHEKPC